LSCRCWRYMPISSAGDAAVCDSTPGAGDGICNARRVIGWVVPQGPSHRPGPCHGARQVPGPVAHGEISDRLRRASDPGPRAAVMAVVRPVLYPHADGTPAWSPQRLVLGPRGAASAADVATPPLRPHRGTLRPCRRSTRWSIVCRRFSRTGRGSCSTSTASASTGTREPDRARVPRRDHDDSGGRLTPRPAVAAHCAR
jgi:hypothetical protein